MIAAAFALVIALAAAPAPPQAGIVIRTALDRTAVWVADRVTYTVTIETPAGVDILTEDLAAEKLKLDGLELVGSDAVEEPGPGDATTHRFRYVLTTHRVDLPTLRIAPLTVRYYVRRAGQRLQDAAPAGEIDVPRAVIAFRSTLSEEQDRYDVRDGRVPPARPRLLALAQPIGIGLLIAAFVPALLWAATLLGGAERRTPARTARQIRRDEEASLASIRDLDLESPDARRRAFSAIDALVRAHLRDVHGVPAPTLTPPEIDRALAERRAWLSTDHIGDLLAACERARYAPPDTLPSADTCRDAIARAEDVIAER